jgi:hypothetical protein
MLHRTAGVLCVALSIAAVAQMRPCTPEDARRADEATDALNSWDKVHE